MFREKSWKGVYRSDADNLLEDFYIPALRDSVSYDRAVGFFSASMLSFAAQGISALIENDGRMRLIFGGEIDEADADAISAGYDGRELSKKMGLVIIETIDNLSDALANQRLVALSWLIANGRLDIKIALKRRGMYHEKIGIFTDATRDRLVFQGSANETTYALLPDFNFESINVFPCWRQELADHFQPYVDGFERLWVNQTSGTHVIDFPEAARERLVKIAAKTMRPPTAEIELDIWARLTAKQDVPSYSSDLRFPKVPITFKGLPFEIKAHQRNALNAWRSRDFHGILAMATGAGKTLTAIYGLTKLFEQSSRLFIVVAVPYQTLADQWVDELSIFNIEALQCYDSSANWSEKLTQAITLFAVGALKFFACVVVNRTFDSQGFQSRLARIPGDALAFVGDECHHHGAPGLSSALPLHARFRLGLSATPRHYFNEDRTKNLVNYYGDVAYEYSLSDALKEGILTPYKYYVHFVDLTEDETEEYLDLSLKISKLAAGATVDDVENTSNEQLKILVFRRSRLIANARNKIDVLKSLMRDVKPAPFHLFYCGDGAVEDDDDGAIRQVDQVSKVLYETGWKVSHFTSRESRDSRKKIIENLRLKFIEGLVAIRCLDEGIDVPDCRVAYILASSRNPKQFIQRRGRILRRAPNKELALIHDFVIRLPTGIEGSQSYGRKLFVGELARISEFGGLSLNRGEVYESLKSILDEYDVQHFFV
jgi:superfamily II DNA or RNA helicase